MATYNGITALRQLRQGLPQVMLLFGPEAYLRKEILQHFRKGATGLNLAYCSAGDEEGLLRQVLTAPPMMAAERVTIVKDFETVWGNQALRDRWLGLLDRLPPFNKVLLLDKDKPNRRVKVYKVLAEKGMVVDCQFLKAPDLRRWINREVKRAGKQIDGRAVEALLNRVGNSLENVKTELQKVLDYQGDDPLISRETVEKVTAATLEAKIFTFVDAIGQRRLTRAYQELEVLYAVGEPPLRIVAMIIRQIRLLLKTKLLLEDRYNTQHIMREIRVPEFVAQKLSGQSRNFSVEEIKGLLKSIAETEEKIKTGQIGAEIGLELWLLAAIG